MSNRDELLDEISQLLSQYRQEVPGKRRAWPESIKQRARALRGTGLNWAQIANRSGIPYHTVLKWRDDKRAGSFALVNVVPAKRYKAKVRTVTVAKPTAVKVPDVVTVTMPNGVRIEGVGTVLLLELLPRLGARQ
jgi:transposase-like protein